MSQIQPASNAPTGAPGPRVSQSEFAPCPNCRQEQASRVGFTWWGGLIGPRILNVVRCLGCGTQYNGKTGGTLTTGIVIYTCVAVGIALVLILMLAAIS